MPKTANTDNGDSGRRNWLILAIVLIGSFMAVLDTTIVNVALPSIEQGAHATADALEWVVSGYALTFGLALVPAGRIGDRFGYKRLFLTGLAVFVVASLACGLAGNSAELVAARLVQGLGAGIYYPAISAIIQRLFAGRDRSRAFGYLGGIVGISTAVGPLLGGLLILAAGVTDGWRWVFLVNVVIGAVELPVAWRLIPRRHRAEEHHLDLLGNGMLAVALLLILVPLVEGRVSGWPAWSWLMLSLAVPAGAVLTLWELRLDRRGGEPVVQVGLLRSHRSFGTGQSLAILYFAGFTSMFFTLSIMWQEGEGRSALSAGLLVLPFALGALLTASNSFRFSHRFGRLTIQGGISGMLAGQGLVAVVLFVSGTRPGYWELAGPLLLAGLGNGLVIAPNQDFVLASVPRTQAGTAGGALVTAQRLGAAIGIAVIGTALFGSGSGSGSASTVMPFLIHHAAIATVVNLCFIAAALACSFGLPRELEDSSGGRDDAEGNADPPGVGGSPAVPATSLAGAESEADQPDNQHDRGDPPEGVQEKAQPAEQDR
ncbi:MAG TPA: MFS transporter [Trebonia sp.]|nr:MFS transporter [Trebonia sp.]